ncbi:putative MFS transporter [Burkholderia sp. OAS925]|jgi:putative MFS transporter|uniref:Major facilitator superfamily MFS_1 n=1 Tax=Paraburkholderia graminis (strain ATCC 700544 / DSM 17151 / LMG 18924 / NCIMB 13744 / C4D1M) TaxID=396598 RepID=B1G1L9_PARG4|nr:MFS transporter [Paraburkholderia graminis]EDT09965.1 major facilitator superfamily MFS_1 [Paraburkholderia graminis C4D1M]MDR6471564.1 putative MFS transporter [Paraburkholderia graminis]MDR6477705.1 putative MFS transporter [Paraburkholderia graminis]CAB3668043.1 Putative niacin/nicotinamide transporter NaiP [Paraburkholderia graminis C4D1M]
MQDGNTLQGAVTRDDTQTAAVEAAVDAASAALIRRIESVPFSRWHTKARIIVGSATFFDAFDALSIAFVLPVLIGLWHIEPLEIGVLIGASYIGQFIGALTFGWYAERRGRIRSVTIAIAIMSVMSMGCALSGSFAVLLVCRFIQGIGVGGEMPVAATYISELSNAHGRGKYFLLYELIFPVGLMATGQIGAWLVPLIGWKIMFWIGAVPGLLIALLIARLPESPRWLISKGRFDEAEAVVRDMEASTDRRIEPGRRQQPNKGVMNARAGWRELLSPFYRGRTLVVWVLWATAFFIANSLNNWLPTLYRSVYHLPLQTALRAASMTNVAQVALLLICAYVIDRVGRRNWTVSAFCLAAILFACLGLFAAHDVWSAMVLGTLSYGLIGSIAAVLYLYTPEVYPTRMRATSTGLATSWLRLASAVGPSLAGLLLHKRGIGSVFVMFAVVAVVGAICALRMTETRERSLEEIAP